MRHIFPALALLALLSGTALAAASIDQKGADALKGQIESALDYYLQMGKSNSVDGLALSGPITVMPKGKFYEVKLPGAVMTTNDGKVNVGTVTINASPGDKDSYFASVAFPAKITYKDPNGVPLMELSPGGQRFAGIWQPAISTFNKVDAEYKKPSIKGIAPNNFTLTADNIKSGMNMTENADHSWTGPANASMTNLQLTAEAQPGGRGADFRIASANLNVKYDSADLKQAAAMKTKAADFLKQNPNPKAEDVKKLVTSLVAGGAGTIGGISSSMSMNDVSLKTTPATSIEKPVNVSMQSLNTSFNADGLKNDIGNASFKGKVAGFHMSNVEERVAGLVPSDINIEAYAEKVPMKELSAVMTSLMTSAVAGTVPADGPSEQVQKTAVQSQLAEAASKIPGLLAKAGATLSIRDTMIKSAELTTLIEGKFNAVAPADAALPPVIVGTLTVIVQGLDEKVAKLQESKSPEDKKMMQGLGILQVVGKPDTAANGRSQRRFTYDMTADGRKLLNGADISGVAALFGTLVPNSSSPGATPPTPAPAP